MPLIRGKLEIMLSCSIGDGSRKSHIHVDSTSYAVLMSSKHRPPIEREHMPKTVGQALFRLACRGDAKDLAVLHTPEWAWEPLDQWTMGA